jgi:hypothetical protein
MITAALGDSEFRKVRITSALPSGMVIVSCDWWTTVSL